MARSLSPSTKQEILENFQLFDKDGNGSLSQDEIKTVVRSTGCNPTEKELQAMFKEIDTDGSGTIQFEEFLNYYTKHFYKPMEDPAFSTREAFRAFDTNGDGYIDLSELRNVMTCMGDEQLTEEEFKEMIKEIDLDFDGKVNYNEFVNMMNQK